MDYFDSISEKESIPEALNAKYLYLPGMEPDDIPSHFMEDSIQLRWQDELGNNVTTLEELKEYVDLTAEEKEKLQEVIDIHPMSIPRYYLSLIDPKDPNDPIRKMAVPSVNELDVSGFYDTSGEKDNTKLPGLQHKYKNTVLLLSANVWSIRSIEFMCQASPPLRIARRNGAYSDWANASIRERSRRLFPSRVMKAMRSSSRSSSISSPGYLRSSSLRLMRFRVGVTIAPYGAISISW